MRIGGLILAMSSMGFNFQLIGDIVDEGRQPILIPVPHSGSRGWYPVTVSDAYKQRRIRRKGSPTHAGRGAPVTELLKRRHLVDARGDFRPIQETPAPIL